MLSKNMRMAQLNNGFTLNEILITVVLVGIITALAIPYYEVSLEKHRMQEAIQTLTAVYAAQKRYALEHNNVCSSDLSNLDISIPSLNYFNPPQVNYSGGGSCTASMRRDLSKSPPKVLGNSGPGYIVFMDQYGNIDCLAPGNNLSQQMGCTY